MFTRRDHHCDQSQLQLWLSLSRDRVRSVSHKLNTFNSCDRVCNCSTDYTISSQSHWPAKWCDTWKVEETLKLRNCKKKLPCSVANGPQRIQKEGTTGRLSPDASMHRCVVYTNRSYVRPSDKFEGRKPQFSAICRPKVREIGKCKTIGLVHGRLLSWGLALIVVDWLHVLWTLPQKFTWLMLCSIGLGSLYLIVPKSFNKWSACAKTDDASMLRKSCEKQTDFGVIWTVCFMPICAMPTCLNFAHLGKMLYGKCLAFSGPCFRKGAPHAG